jgi:hypothetical protein
MANYLEDLSGVLQSFGAAEFALLAVPILIALLACNATMVLCASLLSFASFMLVVAPASAVSGLAIVSGLGSFLAALESVLARRRMAALNKEITDLTSRLTQLETAEQRRFMLAITPATKLKGGRRSQSKPSSASIDTNLVGCSIPSGH